MLSWAILLLCIFVNTVLFRRLPLIEGIVTFIHVLGFFAFIIVLWCVLSSPPPRIETATIKLTAHRTMAPRGIASSVFTEFETNGWATTGLACLVGLNGPVPYLSGADSTVHLSEELKNAAWALPRSMVATAISNYITSFIVVGMLSPLALRGRFSSADSVSILVTLMFCLGDLESVLESPTGQPYIAVVLNATHSVAAAKVLVVVILILVVSCSVNGVTTTSRQLW